MCILTVPIKIWRYRQMAKNTANVIKGVGAGLLTGMMVGFVGSVMMKDNKKWNRKSKRALSAVEDLIEGVKNMF